MVLNLVNIHAYICKNQPTLTAAPADVPIDPELEVALPEVWGIEGNDSAGLPLFCYWFSESSRSTTVFSSLTPDVPLQFLATPSSTEVSIRLLLLPAHSNT